MLQALLPVLLPGMHPSLTMLALKVAQHPVIAERGMNADAAVDAVVDLAKQDTDVTKMLVNVLLQGVGSSKAATEFALRYVFDAPNGQRTDEETRQFVESFKFLNSPMGRIQLPIGCKACRRMVISHSEIKLDEAGNPLCPRPGCGRSIKIG